MPDAIDNQDPTDRIQPPLVLSEERKRMLAPLAGRIVSVRLPRFDMPDSTREGFPGTTQKDTTHSDVNATSKPHESTTTLPPEITTTRQFEITTTTPPERGLTQIVPETTQLGTPIELPPATK